jgi:NADH-quinone oxidoreductase subunit L
MENLLYLVVFPPLIGAIVNGLFCRFLSRGTVSVIGVVTPFISFITSVYLFFATKGEEGFALTATLFDWITTGTTNIALSFYLDPLSMVMALVVTGVGSFIHLYSVGYMHDDPSYARYFSHLNLFMFSMLMLVLGKSLLVMFVGWEGVGLCSYLLIGFWFSDMEKAIAGKKAFIVNRIGDFGFLLGLFILLFVLGGSLDIEVLKEQVSKEGSVLASNVPLVTIVTLCLFVGATGKSAQIPLYVWLPDAMAGPTPVSALIHAATMVTAGVYMVARLNFLFALAPVTMAVVAGIGALTAIFAATIGLAQNDIKKVLAYSTVSQLGYMFLGVGSGAFDAGIFHLMTHAFFKACLFLCAGSVIHALHGEQDIRRMGGLKTKMPITRWTFLISCLAIAGVPPLSGFFSKDEILYNAFVLSHKSGAVPEYLGKIYFALALLGAFLTATYMFRLYFLTFEGDLRSHDAHPHESPKVMTIPLIVLAVGAIFAGFVGLPSEGLNLFHHYLEPVFAQGSKFFVSKGTHEIEYGLMGLSTLVGLAGIFFAYLLYIGAWKEEPKRLTSALPRLYNLVLNKYYVDEIYDFLFVKPFQKISQLAYRFIDALLIDKVMVEGPARLTRGLGTISSPVVNGDVQSYAMMMFLGLCVLIYLIF